MTPILPYAGRLIYGGEVIGSAFLIHESGIVVSCWHVIAGVKHFRGIRFLSLDDSVHASLATVIKSDMKRDLVLLGIKEDGRRCRLPAPQLITMNSVRAGDTVQIQGFGKVHDPKHSYEWVSASGSVVGPVQRDGVRLLEIESQQILLGMSGAAVYLPEFDVVAGVLTGRYVGPPQGGHLRDIGWVASSDALVALSPELLVVIPMDRRARKSEYASLRIWELRGFSRAVNFQGRHQELTQLQGVLGSDRQGTCVITGMGGIGKTRLALEYAYQNQSKYDLVWLVRGTSFDADLRQLARVLKLDADPGSDAELGALFGWLAEHRRWLLILDGLDSPGEVAAALPSGAGHVLITSRHTRWGNTAKRIAVGPLTRGEASMFLRERGVSGTQESIAELSHVLGGLPLALEQAAAFLLRSGKPTQEYIQLLEEYSDRILVQGVDDYPTSTAASLMMSIDTLARESPAALELLRSTAFLSSDGVELDLLAKIALRGAPRFRSKLQDDWGVSAEASTLGLYSLAGLGADTISVHPVTQSVLRHFSLKSDDRKRYVSSVVEVLREECPGDAGDPDLWGTWSSIFNHVVEASSHAVKEGIGLAEAAWLLDRAATYTEAVASSTVAIPLFRLAVKAEEMLGDDRSTSLASRMNNLGAALCHVDPEAALVILGKVYEIDEWRAKRHREPIPGEHLMNYGAALYFSGNKTDGLELMNQGMNAGGDDVAASVTMMLNMASERVHVARDGEEAARLIGLAKSTALETFGDRHPIFANILRNEGEYFESLGDSEAALDCYSRSARIWLDRVGAGYDQTVDAWGRYVGKLLEYGRVNEGLERFREMRGILSFESAKGIEALVHVGIGLLDGDRSADALDCFYEAAAYAERQPGVTAADMARHENNIGVALLAEKRIKEARSHLGKAYTATRAGRDYLACLYEANYAIALGRDGAIEEAVAHCDSSLQKARDGLDRQALAFVLHKVGTAELAVGRKIWARRHLGEAALLLRDCLPEGHTKRLAVAELIDSIDIM